MRKRIKFCKLGKFKFIGHLDLQRLFQRAFRRANVPLAFSQGFNPHPLISITNPLSLGITSECESMDMELKEAMDNEIIVNNLNATLPEELHVLKCNDLDDNEPKSMAAVAASNYIIKCDLNNIKDIISDYMQQDEILIEKLTKKKRKKIVDIKPGIISLKSTDDNTIETILSTGSKLNIKPQVLIESIYKFINRDFDPYDIKYHRKEIYKLVDENKYEPLI